MTLTLCVRVCALFVLTCAALPACSSDNSPAAPPDAAGGQSSVSGGGGASGLTGAPGSSGQSGQGASAGAATGGGSANGGDASGGSAGAGSGGVAGGGGVVGVGGNPTGGSAPGGGGSSGSGGSATGGSAGTSAVGGAPPAFSGPTVNATVTVTRSSVLGHLSPGFAGLSFEKTHLTDDFFTGSNAPLIALCKLLGPSLLRIGANDADYTTWTPSATPLGAGKTAYRVGTVEVDALGDFLKATGWSAMYTVNLKSGAQQPSVDEAVYVSGKLGASLHSIEIGNEINYFANNAVGTPTQQWAAFQSAIQKAAPGVKFAGPAAAGDAANFVVPFANAEGQRLVLLTDHYYKGAASTNPTIADMLKLDPNVVSYTQTLAGAVKSNAIVDGFRWGEMNSYSGHGAAGVSDVFASALWSIDFMLTTAMYGSNGVNFHGGGQNMDNNVCNSGVGSCTKPFHYSPIVEVDSKVTAAAPLFYGMLLVAQAGVGDMYATKASAAQASFSAYTVGLADGSINIVLVNKDAGTGINATVDTGAAVTAASASYLQAPALDSASGVTFGGAGVSAAGVWSPKLPYRLNTNGNAITVVVPPATALLIHAS